LSSAARRIRLDLARDHDHAVGVAEDQVAQSHRHAAAFHGDIDRHDLSATLRVEGTDASREDREPHRTDRADVAHESVGHATRRAARAARRRQQLAPGRDAPRRARRQDHDFVGRQIVHQLDLEFVRILARLDMVDIRIQAGARASDHHQRVIERANAGVHRLRPPSGVVQHVRQYCGEQLLPRDRDQVFGHLRGLRASARRAAD
jgi:hypothetical protein